MREIMAAEARLAEAASLVGLLAASLDAFEVVRTVARAGEDVAPELFAAFMTTADAAVDGREALIAAPSFPGDHRVRGSGCSATDAGVGEITDGLAGLGAVLGARLTHAVKLAQTPADSAACREALGAAQRIHYLMARGDDDGYVG